MHLEPLHVLADMRIPNAVQCLFFAGPFLGVAALWLLVDRMDEILYRLFPDWEWEKRLGWLNLRLQHQTDAILRWIGHSLHATLALALFGIVWGAEVIPILTTRWTDSNASGGLAMRMLVLIVSLVFWLLYLGMGLIPRLRYQYETEELEKFRSAQAEVEREQAVPQRMHSSLLNPEGPSSVRPNRIGPGQ